MKPAVTQIVVSLRNADPTALTALGCLAGPLGFGDSLLDLKRRVLWELTGPAGLDPRGLIADLSRAGELWNPNKESARIRMPGEGIDSWGSPVPGEEGWETFLAWDPDRDLQRRSRGLRRLGGEEWSLSRGTLWSLRLDIAQADRRRERAEEAVICRGAGHGLLVHPQLQDVLRIEADLAPPLLAAPAERR